MTDRMQLSTEAEQQLGIIYATNADLGEAIDQRIDRIEERLVGNGKYRAIHSAEDMLFSMETLYFKSDPYVVVWRASNPQRIVYIGTPSER